MSIPGVSNHNSYARGNYLRNFGIAAIATGTVLLADDVTVVGVLDDPAAVAALAVGFIALAIAAAGCGGEEVDPTGTTSLNPADDQGTQPPRLDPAEEPTVPTEELPVEDLLRENQIVDVTGDRYQEVTMPAIEVYRTDLNGTEKITLSFASNPQLSDENLACVSGAVNLSSAAAPALPVSLVYYKLEAVSNAISDKEDVSPVEEAYDETNRPLIGAVCGEHQNGAPVIIEIPGRFYSDDVLNFRLTYKIGIDGSEYIYGHTYDYRLDVRMKTE